MNDASGESANKSQQTLPRILIIDDTADIRYFLNALLERQYEVLAAESGPLGLATAQEQLPQLILLDVMMPEMDGYQVMERLRGDARTADIPVIFLTALSSVEEEQRGLDLGATDYIAKPISPPILLARVRLHLERSANAKRLKKLSEQLSRYLAPQVYQSLFDGSRQAKIQTQRKRLTVFFSDIRNFTLSTSQWQPDEVTFLLNSYFEEMSKIAAEYGATLDKFIGDAIVIFFGDPHTLGQREDAVQCVKMAMAMQARMTALQQRWKSMGIDKAFEIRIGINSGLCDVGNFGSNLRMEYTIIGREVNLAARLEQAAEPGEILISDETYALVREEIAVDERPPVLAKGIPDPITVFVVRQDRAMPRNLATDFGDLLPTAPPASPARARARTDMLSESALTSASAPSTEGGIDLTLGLSRAMGLKPLYFSMLRRYVDGRKNTTTLIRDALDAGDIKAAELLSHSLRGVSAQIGATRVPGDAGALEQALNEGAERQKIDVLLAALDVSLSQLIATLDRSVLEYEASA